MVGILKGSYIQTHHIGNSDTRTCTAAEGLQVWNMLHPHVCTSLGSSGGAISTLLGLSSRMVQRRFGATSHRVVRRSKLQLFEILMAVYDKL